MDWMTVQYTSGGKRSKTITDWGPVIHRDKSIVVIHPVQSLTKALRVNLHDETGIVLTDSVNESQTSNIDVVATRIWESNHELHIQLPDIHRIEEDKGKINFQGSLSRLIHPFGSKSFKIRVDDVKVKLEYCDDRWYFNIPNTANDLRGQLIQQGRSGSNYLTSNSARLYLHSSTSFDSLSVLV